MRAPRWPLLPAALPVVVVAAVDPGGYAPFGPAKWLVISATVPAAAAVALRHGRRGPDRRTTRVWVAFVVWTAACALVGVDRWYALAGTPERHGGLWLWLLAAAAFVTGVRTAAAGGGRAVVHGAALAAALTGAYAAVELVWRAPVTTDASPGRLGGPFGSAAFLGAACCLLLPAAVGVALDRGSSRAWRAIGAVGVAGTLVALAGSGTRGAWLGALVSAATLGVARRALLRRRWRAVAAVAIAALALATSVALVGPRRGPSGGVLQRTTPAAARADEWRIALRAVAERPIVGAGPEGYRVRFPHLVDDAYERAYGRAVIVDRAHDLVLDLAATVGVPGVVLYLVLLALVGRAVVGALRRGDAVLAGIAGGLVAYVVQQAVLFPIAELEPVAWLLAGVVAASGRGRLGAERAVSPVVPVALGLVAVAALAVGALDVAADRATARALGAGATPAIRADAGRRAARLRPDQVRYRIAASRALAAVDRAGALAQLDAAAQVSPREPALVVERAALVGTADAWRAALAADPRRAASWLQLGLAAAREGDAPRALAAWTRAADLAPRDPAPRLDLALLAIDQGRLADARRALAEARAVAAADDGRVAQVAAALARAGG